MLTNIKSEKYDYIKSFILIVASALLYAVTLKFFVEPADLVPAGFIGLSRLVERLLLTYANIYINYLLLYFIVQIVLTVLVIQVIGQRFAIKTIVWFILMTIFTYLIPKTVLADDLILMTIFGGVLNGVSILLALRAGASAGGTDFIAVYFMNKGDVPIYDYIMYGNWVVIGIFAYFFGWRMALYSIVFQYVSTSLINNMNTQRKLVNLYIITSHGNDVCEQLIKSQKHGITRIWGDGAYSGAPKTMLFMVVSEYEVGSVVELVQAIDPKAFINISQAERVVGNFKHRQIT